MILSENIGIVIGEIVHISSLRKRPLATMFLLVLFVALLARVARAGEWNGYYTGGTYTVSFDKTLNSEIILGSSLTLIGTPDMPTLTAKAGKRHFGVTGSSSSSVPIKTLKLENLRLYGGGSSTLNSGGSIYVSSGALQITNCIIEGNEAISAGAVYISNIKADNTALKNVTFKNNKATAGYGGVFSINYGSPFPIIDCTFIGNFASQKRGGG